MSQGSCKNKIKRNLLQCADTVVGLSTDSFLRALMQTQIGHNHYRFVSNLRPDLCYTLMPVNLQQYDSIRFIH